MPIAYSYVRFSTPEQAAGNSLARQLEAAWKAEMMAPRPPAPKAVKQVRREPRFG
jgi:hypothetical protein